MMPDCGLYREFAERLRQFMLRKGIRRQKDLALALRASFTEVGHWLRCRRLPSRKYWDRLVRAGAITLEELRDFREREKRIVAQRRAASGRWALFYTLEEYAQALPDLAAARMKKVA